MRWHPLLSLKYRIAACIFALEAVMMFLVLGHTLHFSEETTRQQLAENEQRHSRCLRRPEPERVVHARISGTCSNTRRSSLRDPHVLKVLVGGRDRRIVVSTDFSDLGKPVPAQFTDTAERFWRTKTIGNLGVIGMEFSNRSSSRRAGGRSAGAS